MREEKPGSGTPGETRNQGVDLSLPLASERRQPAPELGSAKGKGKPLVRAEVCKFFKENNPLVRSKKRDKLNWQSMLESRRRTNCLLERAKPKGQSSNENKFSD